MKDLPVKKDNFLAEIERMDLSTIKNEKFLVAVATGDPDSGKFLCTTIRGPYEYTSMLQEVGNMWHEWQHHAKVIICEQDVEKPVRVLDANTVDYIECFHTDLITEEMLGGAFDKDFTCQAGLIDAAELEDPRHKKPEAPEKEEECVAE